MAAGNIFLDTCIKKFRHQKNLGDKTFEQLAEADFFFKPSAESNSIAIIVQHLHGNMMSRWINFLTEDGEKEWRKRDEEFEDIVLKQDDIIGLWEKGWQLVFETLESLRPQDVTTIVFIRKEPLTVCDAVIRQIDHYAYHTGQIVQLGRMIKDVEWHSLSIAKGKTKQYNEQIEKNK